MNEPLVSVIIPAYFLRLSGISTYKEIKIPEQGGMDKGKAKKIIKL